MDPGFRDEFHKNGLNYKRSLERIIDKYSKLQYLHGAIEVDLDDTNLPELQRYMRLSKKELSKLESKCLSDLREEALQAQDVTQGSQLDFMHQDGESDETTSHLSAEDDGMSGSYSSLLTLSSLNKSERTCSETDLQPEDQDEELEMFLRSRGTSLVDLYPHMISQIGKAQHRQHVSEAAGSVVRRYRRWRRLSNRSNLNSTFNITHTSQNPKKRRSMATLGEASGSALTRQFPGFFSQREPEPAPLSPLHKVTHLHDWRPQQCSPGKERGSLSRERRQPVLVMDFSCPFEISKPESNKLNETFTVTHLSPPSSPQPRQQPRCHYAVSPSRRYSPSAKASLDLSLGSKRHSLSAHTAGCSVYAPESTAARETTDIYRSPVRPSPLKAKMMMMMMREDLRTSPYAFPRSPKSDCGGSSRSQSGVLNMPQRMPHTQYSQLSPQSHLHSPQPRRHNLRRHLSFDSSLPSGRVPYSQKDLDDDFTNLYHKLVCQNKSSPFQGAPCRKCERGAEAGRRHSSQTLVALALSPHRVAPRKRLREVDQENHPQSKHSREAYCTYSPGSQRHMREMLRRRLCPSELEPCHGGFLHRHRKYGVYERLNITQPSEDAIQPRGWHGPSAALRGSHGREMAAGYFPR